MRALVCVDGRGWEAVVRGAARYLPPDGNEAILVHVVDERATRGHDLALRGLLGRSKRPEGTLDAASRAAAEALLSDAEALLASLRPGLEIERLVLTGPPNEELARASRESGAETVFVGRGAPGNRTEDRIGDRIGDRPATVSGVVAGWRRGPRGEVNGLLLEDGTEVRFPPHRAERVRGVVREGARVEVSGAWRGPEGSPRRHLHARLLTDPGTGASVEAHHDGPPTGPGKRPPLGRTARYVVDHAACDVVLVFVS